MSLFITGFQRAAAAIAPAFQLDAQEAYASVLPALAPVLPG